MGQLDLFEQDFITKWKKVKGLKTLSKYCREVKFDYKTAWFITHKKK